jgi:hypothetical protein
MILLGLVLAHIPMGLAHPARHGMACPGLMQDAWRPVYKTTDHRRPTMKISIAIVFHFDSLTPS